MMKVQAFVISLLLLLLVSGGESRSLEARCATSCDAAQSTNFRYQPGSTYSYRYQAVVRSSFSELEGLDASEISEMFINANVKVDVVSPCEHSLRIESIRMTDQRSRDLGSDSIATEEGLSWSEALQANPMRFSFSDGHVDHVCASRDDPEWVVNIKRGIVSAMQVSRTDEDSAAVVETDVSGTCESSYSFDVISANTRRVQKSKDFLSCQQHDKMLLFAHFTPYQSDVRRQRLIIQNQTCEHTITNSILTSTLCTEEHLFRPFSSDTQGARTTITQQLTFERRRRTNAEAEMGDFRRTTLAYETAEVNQERPFSEIAHLLDELCGDMDDYAQYERVGQAFMRMVFLMRGLDVSGISQMHSSLDGACYRHREAIKVMFRDALKWCGGEGCVRFGAEMIADGSADDETASMWLMTMNMINEPTYPMLEGLLSVLESGRLAEQAYLTTGTILYQLCSADARCLDQSTVRRSLNFFEQKLLGNCLADDEETQKDILMSLRALGNAGRSTAVTTLVACAREEANDAETRLAAIQAFRRMPCGTDRSLESLVFDQDLDSELRIGAYVNAMKCPTSAFMSKLVPMLDEEPSQQVASFVSTHLRNLVASTDPLKGYIKPYLIEADFAKVHELDPRKFSRYHELSYYSESLDAGVTGEGSLVWSPKSFVPRSANLNLTVDVFGQAVNLFEIGARVEGLETLLQDMMKRETFLHNAGIGKIFGSEEDDAEDEDAEGGQPEPVASDSAVEQKTQQYQSTIEKETFGVSWFVRVFGNELRYGNSRFTDVYQQINDDISSVVMDMARGREIKYYDNMVLMNTAQQLPTMIGMPLNIAINGTSTVAVTGTGSMDFTSLLSTTPELAINAEFSPRATVFFAGAMAVDAHVTRVGIETETTMTTSTLMKGRAGLRNGKQFSLRLDSPPAGSKIFSYDHRLMKVVGEERSFPEKSESVWSRDSESNAGSYRLPMGYSLYVYQKNLGEGLFPRSGPTSYELSLYQENEYVQLDLSYDYVQDDSPIPAVVTGSISLGSYSPMYATSFEFSRDAGTVSAAVQFPNDSRDDGREQIELNGAYARDGNQHDVTVTMTQNGETSRLMKTMFVNGWNEAVSRLVLDSTLNVLGGAEQRIEMAGAYAPGQIVSFNSSFTNFMSEPIRFNVGYMDESSESRNRFLVRGHALAVVPGLVDEGADFEVAVKSRPGNYAASLTYQLKDQEEQSVKVSMKNMDDDEQTQLTFRFQSTEYPQFNALLNAQHQQTAESVESTARLSYGETAFDRSTTQLVSVSHMFSTSGSNTDRTEMQGSFEVQLPADFFRKSVSWRVAVDMTEIDARVEVDGADFVQATYRDEAPRGGMLSKSLRVMVPTPWENIVLSNAIREMSAGSYKLTGDLRIGENMRFVLESDLDDLPDRKRFAIELTGDRVRIVSFESNTALMANGFDCKNRLASEYFGTSQLDIYYQGAQDGSFDAGALFSSDPYHYEATIDFKRTEGKGVLTTAIAYKDLYSTLRHISLTTDYNVVPQDDETFRLAANAALETNAFRFSESKLSLLFRGDDAGFDLENGLTLDRRPIFDFQVGYDSAAPTYAASVALTQYLTQAVPAEMSLRVSVTNGDDETAVTVDYPGLSVSFSLTDMLRGTIVESLSSDVETTYQVTLQQFENGIAGRASVDRRTISFRAQLDDNRLNIRLDNSMPRLSMIPRRTVVDLSWTSTGVRTTLTVDNQEASFEARCQSTWPVDCMFDFSPDTLTLDYLPADLRDLTITSASGRFRLNGPVLDFSIQSDQQTLLGFGYDFNPSDTTLKISMEQRVFGFAPRSVVFSADVDGTERVELDLTVDEYYTMSLIEFQFDDSNAFTASLKAEFFTNMTALFTSQVPQIDAKFSVDVDPTSFRLALSTDQSRSLVAELFYRLDEEISVGFDWQQSFTSYMPAVMKAGLAYSLSRQELDLRYDSYFFRHLQTLEPLSENSYRATLIVQQNLLEYAQYYKVVGTQTQVNEYVVTLQSSAVIDDGPAFTTEQTLTMGLPSDGRLVYKYEMSHNMRGMNESIEAEFYTPDYQDRSSPYQYGLSIKSDSSQPEYNMDWHAVITTSGIMQFQYVEGHQSGFIAYLIGTPDFAYNYEISFSPRDGLRIQGDLSLDDQSAPFTGQFSVVTGVDDGDYQVSTSIATNAFELLAFDQMIPKEVRTQTRVGVATDESQLSAGTYFDTVISRVYTGDGGEDVVVENHIDFNLKATLFNWNFEMGGQHDLEFDFMPRNFKYELVVAGSSDQGNSDLNYKSISLAVTYDDVKQIGTFSLSRNRADQSLFVVAKQNSSLLMAYGVPGNMSFSMRRKSDYAYDLSMVYDTNRQSIGFDFDYVNDLNKVIVNVYHDFDMVEEFGIPKRSGMTGQYQLNEGELFAQAEARWGEEARESEINVRWDGSDLASLTSLTYRHEQNILPKSVLPQKLRFKLTRAEDLTDFGVRFSMDGGVEMRASARLDRTDDELAPELYIVQTIVPSRVFPKRLKVQATVNTVEHEMSVRVKRDSSYVMDMRASHTLDSSTQKRVVSAQMSQQLSDMMSPEMEVTASSMIGASDVMLGLMLVYDADLRFDATFRAGFDRDSVYAELTHDQNQVPVPLVSRLDARLTSGGDSQHDVDVTLKRDDVINRAAFSLGWRLIDGSSVSASLSGSHDFEELAGIAPSSAQARFYGEMSTRALMSSLNVTYDDVTLAHVINFEGQVNQGRGYSASAKFTHDNRFLAEASVPNMVSASSSADYNEGQLTSSHVVTWGEDSFVLYLNVDPRFRLDASFAVRAAELDYSGSTRFNMADDTVDASVTWQGEEQASMSGEFRLNDVRFRLRQAVTATVPSDVSVAYRMDADSGETRLSADVDRTTVALILSPTESGSTLTIEINDGRVRELVAEYNLEGGSFSVNLEQNIDESAPRSALFTTRFEGSASAPHIFSSVRVDDVVRTMSLQADMQQLAFSFEHDLPIPLLPRTIAASVAYDLDEPRRLIDVSARLNVDGREGRVSFSLRDLSRVEVSVSHNLDEPEAVPTSPINLTAQLAGTTFSIDMRFGVFQADAQMSVNLEDKSINLQHTFRPLTEYFVPSDIQVQLLGSLDPVVQGSLVTRVDGITRSFGFEFDLRRNRYRIFRDIFELYGLPREIALEFEGPPEQFQATVTVVKDDHPATIFPKIAAAFPASIRLETNFDAASSAGLDLTWSSDSGEDSSLSASYVFLGDRIRVRAEQRGIELLPSVVRADVTADWHYGNASASFVVAERFFNVKAGVMADQLGDGWYGGHFSSDHNLDVLRSLRRLNLMGKGRARTSQGAEVAVAVAYDRFVDYSASARAVLADRSGIEQLETSYDHYLNGESFLFSSEIGGRASGNGDFRAVVNARQGVRSRDENKIELTLNAQASRDDFSLDARFAAAQRWTPALPRRVNDGRLTLSGSAERASADVEMMCDGDAIRFNLGSQLGEGEASAQVSLSSRKINMRSSASLSDGWSRFDANNQYRDERVTRDDRLSGALLIGEYDVSLEASHSIDELTALNVPASARFLYSWSRSEHSAQLSYGEENAELVLRLSDDEYTLALTQTMFTPNEYRLTVQLPTFDSLTMELTMGGFMTTRLAVTPFREGHSFRFDLNGGEDQLSTTARYTSTLFDMNMSNDLFITLPQLATFRFELLDRGLLSHLTYDNNELFDINAADGTVQVRASYGGHQGQVRGRYDARGATLSGTVDDSLSMAVSATGDSALQWRVESSIQGDFAYAGRTYKMDESASFRMNLQDSESSGISVSVDTAFLDFTVSAELGSGENVLSMLMDGAEYSVKVGQNQLMYRYNLTDVQQQVYGLELRERNEMLVFAGDNQWSIALTADSPAEGHQEYGVVTSVNKGAIVEEIFNMQIAIKYINDYLFSIKAQMKDGADAEATVSFDPATSSFVTTVSLAPLDKLNFAVSASPLRPAASFHLTLYRDLVVDSSIALERDDAGNYAIDGTLDMPRVIRVAFKHAFQLTANSVSVSARAQVDNMPATGFELSLRQDLADDRYNYSMSSSVDAGWLSSYVNFRQASVSVWQGADERAYLAPSGSLTAVVDGDEYHVSYDSQLATSSRSTRYDMNLQLRHPHDITILTIPLPRRNSLGFNLLQRKRGGRATVEYASEHLAEPVKLVKSFRFTRDDTAEGQLEVMGATSGDVMLNVAYNWDRLEGERGHVFTVNMQYPATDLSATASLQVVSDSNEAGFEASLLTTESSTTSKWLVGVTTDFTTRTATLSFQQPGTELVQVRVAIDQLVQQAGRVVQEFADRATVLQLSFIYGIEPVDGGYDMFVGAQVAQDKSYTVHLKAVVQATDAELSVYTDDLDDVTTNIVDFRFSFSEGRFVVMRASANPELASSIENVLMMVEGEFNNKVEWIVDNLLQLVNSLSTVASGDALIEETIASLVNALTTTIVESNHATKDFVSTSIESATGLLEDGELTLAASVKSAIVSLMETIASANHMLMRPFDQVVERYYGEMIARLSELVRQHVSVVSSALAYFNADQAFEQAVDDALRQATDFLRVTGDSIFVAVRGPISDLVLVTDEEIVVTIPLAFKVDNVDFTRTPSLDDADSLFREASFAEQIKLVLPELFTYIDYLYQARAFLSLPIAQQIPPFKGYAMVSDFTNFRTFDGKHFNFRSDCASSHVLATDGGSGNFTVMINYDTVPSYDVRVGADHVIVASDGNVAFNNKPATLPVATPSGLRVKRVGSLIQLQYNDDIAIDFDVGSKLLAVEINAFYFAATGGMLGVYDNEPNFDYVTPAGERVADLLDFVRSWEVSAAPCTAANRVTVAAQPSDKCAALYDSINSPFRACLPVVAADAFLAACQLDQADYCRVASAYQRACQISGVASMSMPADCMMCTDAATGESFAVGESRSTEAGSVDMVMVIQETACLKSRGKTISKFMRKFLKQSQSSFNKVQLPNTNFFVVGYGGPGSNNEPHMYSMRGGQVSSGRRSDVTRAIRKINLSAKGTSGDAVAAIEFATRLPFRHGSQQMIIHLSCDQCAESSMAAQVQSTLQSRDISFHHMPIRAIANDHNMKNVYGYNAESTFVKKSKNLDRSAIQEDTADQCHPLAIHSRGSVWDATEMKSSSFVNELTSYLATNVTPGGTRTCTCEVDDNGAVAATCA